MKKKKKTYLGKCINRGKYCRSILRSKATVEPYYYVYRGTVRETCTTPENAVSGKMANALIKHKFA